MTRHAAAGHDGVAGRGVRRRRRRVRAAPQDLAGGARRLGRLAAQPPSRRCARPASTPVCAGEPLDVAAFARIAEQRPVQRPAIESSGGKGSGDRARARQGQPAARGRRGPADGYHDLVTVFQAVGLYDEVDRERRDLAASSRDASRARAPGQAPRRRDATSPCARRSRSPRLAGVAPDVHLHLRKAIPVAGGMAGGSADAAAALVACDALWGLRLDRGRAGRARRGPRRRRAVRAAGRHRGRRRHRRARSPRRWRAATSRGSSPSPTAVCRPRPSTPSATG